MLYLVTGASGSGKTACLSRLRELSPDLVWHDFDEVGVPADADKVWRQQTTEHWLQQVVRYQADSKDVGLSGNIIPGEVLACPSAPVVNGITACLLDCYDVVRIDRLRVRGLHGDTQEMLCWAAWQRMHAVDPQWRPDVIREGGAAGMQWERWEGWQRGDGRWHTQVIDTTAMTIEEVAAAISRWVRDQRTKQSTPISAAI
ncbi:MAG: hypothetical protein ACREBG_15560 [Pyrinomonadaceae bacterium]